MNVQKPKVHQLQVDFAPCPHDQKLCPRQSL